MDRTRLRLREIASREVLTVKPDTPLEAAVRLLAEKHVSSLVVVENDRPTGIVTERDLVRLMCLGQAAGHTVRAVMSAPLLTVPQDIEVAAAQIIMLNRAVRHLVLVDADGALSGVVGESDFRRHFGNDLLSLITRLDSVIDQGGKLMTPAASLSEALETMASCRLDHIVVGQDGVAEGIITEREIPELLQRRIDPQLLAVGEVMNRSLVSVGLSASISEAASRMDQAGVRHLVVVNEQGHFSGVLSQHRMLEKLGVILLGQSRSRLEDHMSMLLEATGIGTWEFDHVQGTLLHTATLDAMLESGTEIVPEDFVQLLDRLDPTDREQVLACYSQVLEGRADRFSVDCRVCGRSGIRWVSLRGKVLERNGAGRVVRSAGASIDISAQKASEERLRSSDARFRNLMEKVPLAMGHVDAHGNILFANIHFETLFGYSHHDLPNLDAWWHLAYPDTDYRERVRNSWEAAVRSASENGGTLQPLEYQVTCRDGQVRQVNISGIALGNDFLAIFNDVTEQHRQQTLLEFSNAVLSRISTGRSLSEVLDFIVRGIQAKESGSLCSILLLDDSGQFLTGGSAPDLPPDYSRAIEGAAIGPRVGSCGTAAYEKREIFVSDIASDPLWAEYKGLALSHGLASCWSSPIFSSHGEVLGTFGVYWRHPHPRIELAARDYVDAATSMAAIAIENERRNEELRKRIDELHRWQQATLGREGRVIELKREINALLKRLGEAPHYPGVIDTGEPS